MATGKYTIEKYAGSQSYMTDNKVLVDHRTLSADFTMPENITTGMAVTPVNTSSANAITRCLAFRKKWPH